ncbi:MAG TPA: hypothetical protein VGI79_22515 [Caulobacteraceae bacterium]|jgi:hypothetical protein
MKALFPWLAALVVLGLAAPVTAAAPSPSADDTLKVKRFLSSYFLKNEDTPDPSVHVAMAFADLKGDGQLDAVVYVSGGGYCGSGGCTTLVLVPSASSYKVIMDEPITIRPIRLLRTSTKGWRDISVVRKGELRGDHFEYDEIVRSFNGSRYRDKRKVPLMGSARLPGKDLIAADNDGTPLYQ